MKLLRKTFIPHFVHACFDVGSLPNGYDALFKKRNYNKPGRKVTVAAALPIARSYLSAVRTT